MTSRVEWHESEWRNRSLNPAVEAGLTRAAIVAQVAMRRGMGSEGGGVLRKASKRKKGGKFVKNQPGKGRNVYFPSPPGRYPGVRTGFLRRAIVWWWPRSRATGEQAPFARIGVPGGLANKDGVSIADYGAILETSSNPKMRRPWAMRTIEQERTRMAREFAKGGRAAMRGGE